jgi:hypothetical protein
MNLLSLSSRLQYFYCSNLNDPPKHWQPSARLHAVTSHIHWHNINTLGTGYLNCLYAYKHKSASPVLNVLISHCSTSFCTLMQSTQKLHIYLMFATMLPTQTSVSQCPANMQRAYHKTEFSRFQHSAIFILNCYLKQQNHGTHTSLQYSAKLWNLQSTHCLFTPAGHVMSQGLREWGKAKNTHSSTLADICARMCKTEGSFTQSNIWCNVT